MKLKEYGSYTLLYEDATKTWWCVDGLLNTPTITDKYPWATVYIHYRHSHKLAKQMLLNGEWADLT